MQSGHYRASVLAHEEGSRVRIEWVTADGRDIVTSVTISDLAEGAPWQVSNAEFRPEDGATLLVLSARDPDSRERRTFSLELGPPGVVVRRDPP